MTGKGTDYVPRKKKNGRSEYRIRAPLRGGV